MIVYEIDRVDRLPQVEIVTVLSDREYTIVCRWMDRKEFWYMDLFDAAGDAIFLGKALGVNTLVAQELRDERLPEGKFSLIDPHSNVECDFDGFGDRCLLAYLEPSEVQLPSQVNVVQVPYVLTAL